MNPIGLDIGGANLKASNGAVALSQSFPLWKEPRQLAAALTQLLLNFPAGSPLAVTMTGELADCFETRAEGVAHILEAVEQAGTGRLIAVWQTGGEFVSVEDANVLPEFVAAANWHALATWAGRMSPAGRSLLIDIGSTTTDIIPIEDGLPITQGTTDRERLRSGELLYLGVCRTPLSSLCGEITISGEPTGVARETFATTLDLHLLSGELPEDPTCLETANGRPATRQAAMDRIARMVCSDRDELSPEDIEELAQAFRQVELNLVVNSIQKAWSFTEPPECVLLSGAGEFLGRAALTHPRLGWGSSQILSLSEMLGGQKSQAACAEALARLASERLREDDIRYR